ncbi:UDP-glucose 4-epimerase GalE [Apibacter muscae]|uniref:UDP-glucose 4-epimerase GalE n=1 Tax=Apibacter muscae TaxID=2509004 RepID=UPI0011ADD372|nr:UDP-glucose 4-epimerase GalE [Apibacter muscae]TWP24407.1 UDP-glucose 4-epimerase GalE [Apibacter muscae]
MNKIKILVTGGLGYIGSHTVVELINSGFEPIIVDDLSNSELFILDNIYKVSGQKPKFYKSDICDINSLKSIFEENKDLKACIHFAAKKAVGESMEKPLLYYRENLVSLLNVLDLMKEYKIHNFVFSSSATVYGEPEHLPVQETFPIKKALSSYGSTKQMAEDILEKVATNHWLNALALRYFNPVGAHLSGLLGELPKGIPSNLMPFITQTAIGIREELTIFGKDYNTPDGTCIRDYIHVVDLAKAHVYACNFLLNGKGNLPYDVFNIGTGEGYSVLDMVETFERVNKVKLKYKFGERRNGDVASIYASSQKANEILGWKTELSLDDMVKDSWNWEKNYRNQ